MCISNLKPRVGKSTYTCSVKACIHVCIKLGWYRLSIMHGISTDPNLNEIAIAIRIYLHKGNKWVMRQAGVCAMIGSEFDVKFISHGSCRVHANSGACKLKFCAMEIQQRKNWRQTTGTSYQLIRGAQKAVIERRKKAAFHYYIGIS